MPDKEQQRRQGTGRRDDKERKERDQGGKDKGDKEHRRGSK